MRNSIQRAKIRYEESATKLQLLQNQILQTHFPDSQRRIAFFKEIYLPQIVEIYTFHAIWEFEAKFPLGGQMYKDNYFQTTFENLNYFFSS